MNSTQDHIDNALNKIFAIKEDALKQITNQFNETTKNNKDVQSYKNFAKAYLSATSYQKKEDIQTEYSKQLDSNTMFNLTMYMETIIDLINTFNYSFIETTSDEIINKLLLPIQKGYDHNPILDTMKGLFSSKRYHSLVGTYFNLTAPDQSDPHYWITLTG